MRSLLIVLSVALCAVAAPQNGVPLSAPRSLRPRQEMGHAGHGNKPSGGQQAAAPANPRFNLFKDPKTNIVKSYLAKFGTRFLPSMRAYQIEDAEVTFKRDNAKRQKFWFGPFHLNTADQEEKNQDFNKIDQQSNLFYRKAEGFPTDISIISSHTTLIHEDGSPAGINTGVYNHHINFADASKVPEGITTCPGVPPHHIFGLSFFAAVSEDKTTYTYTTRDNQIDSGFYLGNANNVLLTAEMINYTNKSMNVYMVVDMHYIPGKPKMDASFETLSVTQCESNEATIALPHAQSKFAMTSKDMTMQYDGYIISARGHLHDGGTNVVLTINGNPICDSKALYGLSGTETGKGAALDRTSVCETPTAVKKGDIVKLTANYDLDLHPPREHVGGGMTDEMGIVIFSFVKLLA